jgi:hypothetical protein
MKRFLRIFELSKNEQRVVLIVLLILITIGFVGYVRRVNRFDVHVPAAPETKISPSPVQTENDQ